jgi:hypothetical protein
MQPVVFTERVLDVHKAFVADFWKEFGVNGQKHYLSAKGKVATLKRLRELGCVVLKHGGTNPRDRRNGFNEIKSERHRLQSHKHCFVCKRIAQNPARHHIIWIKNGGINSKRNMITLCFECHAEIHPWLKKAA